MIKQLLALTLLMLLSHNSITLATTNARDEQKGDCIRQGKCKD